MKRKDVWVIVAVLAVAAILFVAMPQGRNTLANIFGGSTQTKPTVTLEPEITEEPASTPLGELPDQAPKVTPPTTVDSMILRATPAPKPTLRPAQSYVRVSVGGQVAALLPLIEDTTYPVKQLDGKENVVSIGHNRVSMHSSTCENQDCVQQGEITLENKDSRVLFNMVVCLPNQVMLELLTPEEAQAAYEAMT